MDDTECWIPETNYTYELRNLNGPIFQITEGDWELNIYDNSFFINIFNNTLPSMLAVPLNQRPSNPFKFSDGTSITNAGLISFIRPSKEGVLRPEDVLTADICALSFCAQKRNVSVSLNQVSSSILQTVFGIPTYGVHWYPDMLSFEGGDINMTHPSQGPTAENTRTDVSSLCLWLNYLNLLMDGFGGHLMPLHDTPNSYNIIGAFNAPSNISMTMEKILPSRWQIALAISAMSQWLIRPVKFKYSSTWDEFDSFFQLQSL